MAQETINMRIYLVQEALATIYAWIDLNFFEELIYGEIPYSLHIL